MLNILYLEDSKKDIEIIRELLIDSGFDFKMDCTMDETEFVSMLRTLKYDIILADFNLPGFNGFTALQRTMEISPDVPFICISGAIGEETAVELLRQGAVDYILKDRLVRLPSAVKHALDEAKEQVTLRHADDEIRIALTKYKTLFDCLPMGITITDEKGNILETNPTAAKLLSIPQEVQNSRDIDSPAWRIVRPDGTPMPAEEFASVRALKQKRKVENVEMGIIKDDNMITWINVSATLLPLEGYGVVITYNDITERKHDEESLKSSEEKFSKIGNSALDAVVLINDKGNIEFWNPAAERIFGFTKEEVQNKNLHSLITPEKYLQVHLQAWEKFIKTGKGNAIGRVMELTGKRKNGEEFPVEIALTSVEIRDSHWALAYVRDITERKRAETELITAKEKAEEMNRLKSSFLANMSHELRTPLQAINGYADILHHDIEDPQFKEMAKGIYNSGIRLSETLNLILDLSKLESEKMDFFYQKIDLVKETEDIIDQFTETAERKGLVIKFVFSQSPISINTDGRAIRSILNNLINNAVKYTDEGGISINISLLENFVEIKVADSGIGIALEHQQTIFEEFRQVSEGISRNFEGTGLGLNITKKLVEKFGGVISVDSEIGIGSTFIVKLPVPNKEEIKEVQTKFDKAHPPELPSLKSLKRLALLVDDDPFVYLVMKKFLPDKVNLESTMDGESAIELCNRKQYDFIFMDINLKRGIDGKQVTQKIRKIKGYESIPVIATTAYSMVGDKEEFLAAGCSHYLSKPFTRETVLQLIDSIFND
ncbi:MAG: response regulator [Ignavibacteriaceae bacterium]